MRPMSIRAPGSAGSAGAGEPPSCAAADSEGGEAGSDGNRKPARADAEPDGAQAAAAGVAADGPRMKAIADLVCGAVHAGVGGLVGWLALPTEL